MRIAGHGRSCLDKFAIVSIGFAMSTGEPLEPATFLCGSTLWAHLAVPVSVTVFFLEVECLFDRGADLVIAIDQVD